jgi:hypothetical protein
MASAYFVAGLLICMVDFSLTEMMSFEFSTPKLLETHEWFWHFSGLIIALAAPTSSVTDVDVTAVFAA